MVLAERVAGLAERVARLAECVAVCEHGQDDRQDSAPCEVDRDPGNGRGGSLPPRASL